MTRCPEISGKQTSNTEARNYFPEPGKFYSYFYDFSLMISSYLCAYFIRNWVLWGEVSNFETDFSLQPGKITFTDTNYNLIHKAILGLRWITQNCGTARCILKVDDDVVVSIPQIIQLLSSKYAHVNRTIS